MGADAAELVGWVARVGLRLIAIGLIIGLAVAWLASGAARGPAVRRDADRHAVTAAAVFAAVGRSASWPRSCRRGGRPGSIRWRSCGAADGRGSAAPVAPVIRPYQLTSA